MILIEAIFDNSRLPILTPDWFPLIPLPIIEAINCTNCKDFESVTKFPLIPLPIIEAII